MVVGIILSIILAIANAYFGCKTDKAIERLEELSTISGDDVEDDVEDENRQSGKE